MALASLTLSDFRNHAHSEFADARRFNLLLGENGAGKTNALEAISLLSVGVDFGITQVVNGNWGVHAIIRKELFTA